MMPIGNLSASRPYGAYPYLPVYASRHSELVPVTPVQKVPVVQEGHSSAPMNIPAVSTTAADLPASPRPLEIREGADPVAMAVRGRIEYLSPEQVNALIEEKNVKGGEEALTPAEIMKESECETCKSRKYQDGSNDPGVSFKTPTRIDPDQAASAVRGHEMEHVVREQAKARREDREVVQQSVTLHTAICPECGDVYVSGGTTRTATRANPDESQSEQQQEQQRPSFAAIA